MDINEIINSIPFLTKGQLYKLHSEAAFAIKQVEESEQRYRENVRQRQREIVNQMNKCLREFHALSASLRAINADDCMEIILIASLVKIMNLLFSVSLLTVTMIFPYRSIQMTMSLNGIGKRRRHEKKVKGRRRNNPSSFFFLFTIIIR